MRQITELYRFVVRQDKAILHGFLAITVLRIIEKFSGLVLVVLLFRLLDKEQVAEYGYILTIVAVCAIFGIQEFQNTISQSVARGFPGTYRRAVPLAFSSSLLGTVVLAGFAGWFLWSGNLELGDGFVIAAAVFPFFQGLNQWKGVYLGEKDFTRFAKVEATNAITKAALIVAALFAFPGSIVAPVLVFFAIPAIQNIWQTRLCHGRIKASALDEHGAINYGFRANLYSAIGIVSNHLEKILIFALLSPAHLAIYMAAEKFAELLQSLVQDFAAVLGPRFSTIKKYTKQLDERLKLFSVAIGAVIAAFAIFVLPGLLVLIFGSAYQESVIYAQILVCGVAVRNVATLRFRFIRSQLDMVSYKSVLIYSSLGRIVASLILIPVFGLGGAVASVFAHRLALSVIVAHSIKTRYLRDERT
jgi:O-antigen/teichoic acid export membrane protein